MISAFPHAMPVEGFMGGVLIGLAAATMLLGLGRIAGVSGMAARATGIADSGAPRNIAIAFVIGLPLGAFLVARLFGEVQVSFPTSLLPLIAGGLLVGFGTRLGSGCTSGHGVCGLSRLSPRSMVATALFMASGFVTVAAMRFGGLL
ncbi:YeeE/YedE family protein [Sphingorhabdus lacus]|uniref:YeeE/YedE family protein n=1 Tax=Sphingorhabdus lacus TaxID=392610 RepID=A0A6I6LA46_9SPHN|nr:YeeE/YedE thiosulfate transporter family protein [Sphingorhabdus lacus]QGY80936.1 YeeE/YedE family protein [Sphingorhabdus lacus]